jgi:ABC-type uncharacterized transport system substrate-binding protein
MLLHSLRSLAGVVAALLLYAGSTMPAAAHPHVWITVETTVLYENGAFTGVRHKWTFDEFYTAMAIEGLDKNQDGKYDRSELAELTKVNMDGLKEFAYFTLAGLAGTELKFTEPRDYYLEHADGVLSLHFTLPLAQPVLTEAKGLAFTVQDPTFFIAFDFAKTSAVKLSEGAPGNCKVNLGSPVKDGVTASASGTQASPMQLGGLSISMAKTISVACTSP